MNLYELCIINDCLNYCFRSFNSLMRRILHLHDHNFLKLVHCKLLQTRLNLGMVWKRLIEKIINEHCRACPATVTDGQSVALHPQGQVLEPKLLLSAQLHPHPGRPLKPIRCSACVQHIPRNVRAKQIKSAIMRLELGHFPFRGIIVPFVTLRRCANPFERALRTDSELNVWSAILLCDEFQLFQPSRSLYVCQDIIKIHELRI